MGKEKGTSSGTNFDVNIHSKGEAIIDAPGALDKRQFGGRRSQTEEEGIKNSESNRKEFPS